MCSRVDSSMRYEDTCVVGWFAGVFSLAMLAAWALCLTNVRPERGGMRQHEDLRT